MKKQFLHLAIILFLLNGCDSIESAFKTKLSWQKSEPGKMTWRVATDYCQDLSLNGRTDWRLPNVDELLTILDRSKKNPAADKSMFPDIHSSGYWSSATHASNIGNAWYVYFGGGDVYNIYKSASIYVRCVRGVQ